MFQTVPRRLLQLVAVGVLLLVAALQGTPASDAQGSTVDGSLYSEAEQFAAAMDVFAQLDAIDGPIDPLTLTLDPALGPPPWLSLVPDRHPATIDAWNAIAGRTGETKAGPGATSGTSLRGFADAVSAVVVADIEAVDETQLNDTIATGQIVSGFGTGFGEETLATITGALGTAAPPLAPEPDCPSVEEDGALPNANAAVSSEFDVPFVLCSGTIGDGAFAATSGDIDFFSIGTVDAGTLLSVDVGTFVTGDPVTLTTAVYDSAGTLLGSIDDADSTAGSVLAVTAPARGEYFAAVAGEGSLPTDPADPASGQGVTTAGDYLLVLGAEPGDPEPCLDNEPNDTIPSANTTSTTPDGTIVCTGLVGNGAFGDSTGDFDFFAFDAAADNSYVVDIVVPQAATPTPATIAVYDAAGALLATIDDDGSDPNAYLSFSPEAVGTYYALVSSPGVLPGDPFDGSSGSIAGPDTSYTLAVYPAIAVDGSPTNPPAQMAAMAEMATASASGLAAGLERLSPPCRPVEDDGAIDLATMVILRPRTSVRCSGMIGDGPHGQFGGDFDYYAVDALRGDALVADIDVPPGSALDAFLTVYDDEGTTVATNDDFDGRSSRVAWPVSDDGTYYVAVGAFGSVQADPFDSASGSTPGSLGAYELTLATTDYTEPDIDVYLVDLEIGDAFSAGFTTPGQVTILDPNGVVVMQTNTSAVIRYPQDHPLRFAGNAGGDHVAAAAGMHAVILDGGPASYSGELRVRRSGLSDAPGDDVQIFFLDFDGASFDGAIFNPAVAVGSTRTLSPMADTLPRWGLSSSDENAVIDAVLDKFQSALQFELYDSGGNGNRDATGTGGELDIVILNSRDHDDPWGQPNVSRIIIGGSRIEAGINVTGIAQSIDPGNLAPEETALVLLDLLSDPAGGPRLTLNDIDAAPGVTRAVVVGDGIGAVAAHEAGHLLGNWHTAPFNGVPNIMDTADDMPSLLGIGSDLVLGSPDDPAMAFASDQYVVREGLRGTENSAARAAHGLSTGQANVVIPPPLDGPPDGVYFVRSALTGRLLSAQRDDRLDSAALDSSLEWWELRTRADGVRTLRNIATGSYLAGQGSRKVGQTDQVSSDIEWALEETDPGEYRLQHIERESYLSALAIRVHLGEENGPAQQWQFERIGGSDSTTPFVGETVAIRSAATGAWLRTFPAKNTDQAAELAEGGLWTVFDAGDGYVYLRSVASGRFLDARNRNNDDNVRTSLTPRDDDRWRILDGDGAITLQNAATGGFLTALGPDEELNVVEGPIESLATEWQFVVDPTPGG